MKETKAEMSSMKDRSQTQLKAQITVPHKLLTAWKVRILFETWNIEQATRETDRYTKILSLRKVR